MLYLCSQTNMGSVGLVQLDPGDREGGMVGHISHFENPGALYSVATCLILEDGLV